MFFHRGLEQGLIETYLSHEKSDIPKTTNSAAILQPNLLNHCI